MTIEKPLWLGPNPTSGEVVEYSAQADRQILSTLFTEGIGKVQGGDLLVAPRAAGANMTVEVAAGTVYVTGDDVTRQGLYRANVTATESVTIGAAPASNSRIDLVVARIWDAQAVGGTKHGLYLEVVVGTAAASPVAPDVPKSAVPLAQVLVAAGATSVQAGAITDRRLQSGAASLRVGTQFQPMTQAERDALTGTDLSRGRAVFNTTTGRAEVWGGAAWLVAGTIQVDVFTASGTWTKPVGAKLVDVICIGAGGGATANTANRAGAGGGGYSRQLVLASAVPGSVNVTVGAGGTGSSNGGSAGTAGGASSFADLVSADGGATTAGSKALGGAATGTPPSLAGAGATDTDPSRGGNGDSNLATAAGYSAPYGGGGGGTGGATAVAGGASGALAGGAVTQPGNSRSGTGLAGSGGGGASGSTGSFNGGAGGIPGGGGGCGYSAGPGAGGSGGRGEVIVVTIF